jgi:uncharacterized protein YijF (DUF1287 family)
MARFLIPLILMFSVFWPEQESSATLYTIKARVHLRSGPGLTHQIVRILDHNQTLALLRKSEEWLQVRTLSGQKGYVHQDMVSDIWIKIYKKERRLLVLKGDLILKTYAAALSPFNPLGDKVRQGDGGTPEGRFYICEMIRHPRQAKYGARSMRLSYPNKEDARRALKDRMINQEIYLGVERDIRAGRIPNQKTPLGGSIRIHGGGSSRDWTLGCIALNDEDVKELFSMVFPGTRVEIYKSAYQDRRWNATGYLNRKILKGAKKQLVEPSLYTPEAGGLISLSYPDGDIKRDWAVCTDIVIRALREAGIDLQALLYEDALSHPRWYHRWIKRPNYHIDHRRTRNLQIYFRFHSTVLPRDKDYQPGDIVTMDTGIANGTVFDHIGILDDRLNLRGLPKVINIWTTGYRTASMDLLGNQYPTVVGHFRLTHRFDYQ